LRRTTRQFLSRFFNVFNELAIFMTRVPRERRTIGMGAREVNAGG
jgi:hypothetical protein